MRLQRHEVVWNDQETDCFGLNFVEKVERRLGSTIPDTGTIL